MKKILKGFLKGGLIGLLLLPLEFVLLSSVSPNVYAQESLRDQLRLTIDDPRDTRVRPCEEDPRQGCARPIPRQSPSPASPSPASSPEPEPSIEPSPSAEVSPPPASSPSPSSQPIGGNGDEEDEDEDELEEVEKIIETRETIRLIERDPAVQGLSYTGSGQW